LLVGKYDKASATLQEALQLNPNDPNIHNLLAGSYSWDGLSNGVMIRIYSRVLSKLLDVE